MKARLFTSLSNGLSGVKSRAFSLRRAGFRTKCNLHFPERLLHPSKCLLHRRKRLSLFPLFPKKLLFTSWFISIEQQPETTKRAQTKRLRNYLFVITQHTPKRESRSIESKTAHREPNANSGHFFTPTGEKPEINDSGRVRKAKSQNDKKRLSQGSLIYIVPKNTTFA